MLPTPLGKHFDNATKLLLHYNPNENGENAELSYPDGSRIKNALVELGHAVSKSDLNISSRRHIEMFWDLVGKM